MKILYIITGLGMGGAERQVCDLTDELNNLGNDVRLVALNSKEEAKTFPKTSQVQVDFLEMAKNPIGLIKAIFALRKIILTFQPDIVHCHMFHANIIGRLTRLFVKFPRLISTAHSTNEGSNSRMFAYRCSNWLSDLNTNVSEEAVEAFVKRQAVKRGQMIAMPNGIDTNRFKRNEIYRDKLRRDLMLDEAFTFLAVGRLGGEKDYPNLLNAFKLVNQDNTATKLVIVGTGVLESELKQLAQDLGISDNVIFLGLRKDIPEIMNIADTYVLSSKYEGFGIVLAEAMLSENIVIATNCGGTKDVLGEFGYLVESQNYIALSVAMKKAMALSGQEKKQMGIKAREHIILNYSLSEVAQKWISLYKGI